MSSLEFTDITLEINDLEPRARGLDEEEGSDILGGWGRLRRMRRRASRMGRRMRSRASAMRRRAGRTARRASKWRNRTNFPGRRRMKQGLMMKAKFHERKAAFFRGAAARI